MHKIASGVVIKKPHQDLISQVGSYVFFLFHFSFLFSLVFSTWNYCEKRLLFLFIHVTIDTLKLCLVLFLTFCHFCCGILLIRRYRDLDSRGFSDLEKD